MGWPPNLISLRFSVLVFLSLLPFPQAADAQTGRFKGVAGGDMLLLTNGEGVRLICVDVPEIHESKKLGRDAQRSGRYIKTIKEFKKGASAFTESSVDGKRIGLGFSPNNAYRIGFTLSQRVMRH